MGYGHSQGFNVPFAPPNSLILSERIIRTICDVEDETAKSPEVGTICALDFEPTISTHGSHVSPDFSSS
jgi:hypothetical protein